jgi:hypothetical protein
MTELEALKNATSGLGLEVHEKQQEDKRRTVKMYFLQIGKTSISPVLDYENMNHFLLGYRRAAQILCPVYSKL